MAINSEDLIGGNSGGQIQLAPDINYPVEKQSYYSHRRAIVTSANTLSPVLNLSGKFVVDFLGFDGIGNNVPIHIDLEVDGVKIWDTAMTTPPSGTIRVLYGGTAYGSEIFTCEESLVLKISANDGNFGLLYGVRPIL